METLIDIPYNFLIGDDGNVYEGRGFGFQGEIVIDDKENYFDESAIIVAFIGYFKYQQLRPEQVKTFENFLNHFKDNKIRKDYTLLSQNQFIHGSSDEFEKSLQTIKKFYKSKLSCIKNVFFLKKFGQKNFF